MTSFVVILWRWLGLKIDLLISRICIFGCSWQFFTDIDPGRIMKEVLHMLESRDFIARQIKQDRFHCLRWHPLWESWLVSKNRLFSQLKNTYRFFRVLTIGGEQRHHGIQSRRNFGCPAGKSQFRMGTVESKHTNSRDFPQQLPSQILRTQHEHVLSML